MLFECSLSFFEQCSLVCLSPFQLLYKQQQRHTVNTLDTFVQPYSNICEIGKYCKQTHGTCGPLQEMQGALSLLMISYVFQAERKDSEAEMTGCSIESLIQEGFIHRDQSEKAKVVNSTKNQETMEDRRGQKHKNQTWLKARCIS